jgi:hypothetical protein
MVWLKEKNQKNKYFIKKVKAIEVHNPKKNLTTYF